MLLVDTGIFVLAADRDEPRHQLEAELDRVGREDNGVRLHQTIGYVTPIEPVWGGDCCSFR